MTVNARATQPVLYASAARTVTPTAADLYANGARGIRIVIDVTLVPGAAPSVVPTVDGLDDLSGKWFNLLTGVAITATGTTVLTVYPGVTVAANVAVSAPAASHMRLVLTHGNANSCTYSAAAHLLT